MEAIFIFRSTPNANRIPVVMRRSFLLLPGSGLVRYRLLTIRFQLIQLFSLVLNDVSSDVRYWPGSVKFGKKATRSIAETLDESLNEHSCPSNPSPDLRLNPLAKNS